MMAWRRDPPAARLIKHCPSSRRGRAAPAPTRQIPRRSDNRPSTLPTPWRRGGPCPASPPSGVCSKGRTLTTSTRACCPGCAPAPSRAGGRSPWTARPCAEPGVLAPATGRPTSWRHWSRPVESSWDSGEHRTSPTRFPPWSTCSPPGPGQSPDHRQRYAHADGRGPTDFAETLVDS